MPGCERVRGLGLAPGELSRRLPSRRPIIVLGEGPDTEPSGDVHLDDEDLAITRDLRLAPTAFDMRSQRQHHTAMTHDHRLSSGGLDRFEYGRRTPGDVRERFTSQGPPLPEEFGAIFRMCVHRLVGCAGQFADLSLPQGRFDFDRARVPERLGNESRGSTSAVVGTRDHPGRGEALADLCPRRSRLGDAPFGEIDVVVAGELPETIALGLAVPDEQDPSGPGSVRKVGHPPFIAGRYPLAHPERQGGSREAFAVGADMI